MAPSEPTQSQQQLFTGSQDLASPPTLCASAASLAEPQQALAPAESNRGCRGPQQRASAANELSGLARGAVETQALWLPRGKTHTHTTKDCLLTHAYTPSLPRFPFPMHMFATWLWRKCLNRSCSKTDARSVVLATGVLFASEGAASVCGVFTNHVCPEFCEAQARRQLRCENTVRGIERRSRWRLGGVEEQVLILTDHASLNMASFSPSLPCLFTLSLQQQQKQHPRLQAPRAPWSLLPPPPPPAPSRGGSSSLYLSPALGCEPEHPPRLPPCLAVLTTPTSPQYVRSSSSLTSTTTIDV